jgi:putative heme degradation protein
MQHSPVFPRYPVVAMPELIPPLLARPTSDHPIDDAFPPQITLPAPLRPPDADDDDGPVGSKERNRLAAQKWRQKKDKYLIELENMNDVLRKQALDMVSSVQALKVANELLQNELNFFQRFMCKVMSQPGSQSSVRA